MLLNACMHLWKMVRLRSIEGEPPTFAACRLADVESPDSPHFHDMNYESQVFDGIGGDSLSRPQISILRLLLYLRLCPRLWTIRSNGAWVTNAVGESLLSILSLGITLKGKCVRRDCSNQRTFQQESSLAVKYYPHGVVQVTELTRARAKYVPSLLRRLRARETMPLLRNRDRTAYMRPKAKLTPLVRIYLP